MQTLAGFPALLRVFFGGSRNPQTMDYDDEAILKLSKAMADEEPEYVRWARRAEAGGIDE